MSASPQSVVSSFIQRQLRASLTLNSGTFPGTDSNTLVLSGFRMLAQLQGAGSWTNVCDLSIFGMKQADMNAVTVLFGQSGIYSVNTKGYLTLETPNASGWLTIFQGSFFDAYPDYTDFPRVCLKMTCNVGYAVQVGRASPNSYSGATSIASIASQFASLMGFAFENNGVTGTLNSPYFHGSLLDQWRELCASAKIDYYFNPAGKLCICPKGQPRQGNAAIVLNAQSGLIGYVSLNRMGGVEIDCLFNPAIELGLPVQVTGSPVPGTNGLWFPYSFSHALDAIKPGGRWQTHLSCLPNGASASAAIAQSEAAS